MPSASTNVQKGFCPDQQATVKSQFQKSCNGRVQTTPGRFIDFENISKCYDTKSKWLAFIELTQIPPLFIVHEHTNCMSL